MKGRAARHARRDGVGILSARRPTMRPAKLANPRHKTGPIGIGIKISLIVSGNRTITISVLIAIFFTYSIIDARRFSPRKIILLYRPGPRQFTLLLFLDSNRKNSADPRRQGWIFLVRDKQRVRRLAVTACCSMRDVPTRKIQDERIKTRCAVRRAPIAGNRGGGRQPESN